MLLSVHAIDGSDSAPTAGDWSIGPGLDLRQLGAGVDAQFGECIVDMVSHGMEGKVQLRGDAATALSILRDVWSSPRDGAQPLIHHRSAAPVCDPGTPSRSPRALPVPARRTG
jgi:hypothetical protein